MDSRDRLDQAVEAALSELIEAIYHRSDALARNTSPRELAELDRRVADAEERWRKAKEAIHVAPSAGKVRAAR